MKKSSEVLGLKVMGIKEGRESGVVQDIMVNAGARSVEYLILKNSAGYEFRAVNLGDIVGIGVNYVVTGTVENAKKLYESADILRAVEKGFFMLGATVLSSAGNILGAVKDFSFDEKTGSLSAVYLDNGAEYGSAQVASLAGNVVFIDESAAEAPRVSRVNQESKQFLLGKTLQNDVGSDDGAFFAASGTVLTSAVLDEAELHDAILLMTLNV
ncbi:MAG: PRC-barrel domain-containing protein [Clostridiaceae bacterium]|nr:PRC-barrel domain-containing protein [Eubacteriales bacterium]